MRSTLTVITQVHFNLPECGDGSQSSSGRCSVNTCTWLLGLLLLLSNVKALSMTEHLTFCPIGFFVYHVNLSQDVDWADCGATLALSRSEP